MTKIEIRRKGNFIIGIDAKGHSGYAEMGQDIVCSAVSVLMQALIVGIEDVAKYSCHYIQKEGYFSVKWDTDIAQSIDLLTQTVVLSFRGIAEAYPSYVHITEVQC